MYDVVAATFDEVVANAHAKQLIDTPGDPYSDGCYVLTVPMLEKLPEARARYHARAAYSLDGQIESDRAITVVTVMEYEDLFHAPATTSFQVTPRRRLRDPQAHIHVAAETFDSDEIGTLIAETLAAALVSPEHAAARAREAELTERALQS